MLHASKLRKFVVDSNTWGARKCHIDAYSHADTHTAHTHSWTIFGIELNFHTHTALRVIQLWIIHSNCTWNVSVCCGIVSFKLICIGIKYPFHWLQRPVNFSFPIFVWLISISRADNLLAAAVVLWFLGMSNKLIASARAHTLTSNMYEHSELCLRRQCKPNIYNLVLDSRTSQGFAYCYYVHSNNSI